MTVLDLSTATEHFARAFVELVISFVVLQLLPTAWRALRRRLGEPPTNSPR